MKNERCETCHLPIEKEIEGINVPCSEYHVRCVRCGWPVAKSRMGDAEICDLCKGKKA